MFLNKSALGLGVRHMSDTCGTRVGHVCDVKICFNWQFFACQSDAQVTSKTALDKVRPFSYCLNVLHNFQLFEMLCLMPDNN